MPTSQEQKIVFAPDSSAQKLVVFCLYIFQVVKWILRRFRFVQIFLLTRYIDYNTTPN